MMSVIVLCTAARHEPGATVAPEAVVRTLAALVAASVHGLVRDLVLAGPKDASLALIADHAGCACVEADREADFLRGALALVRAGNLLILRPGHVPEIGFIEEAEDLLAEGVIDRGRRIYAAPTTFWQRLIPSLAPVVGLIAAVKTCRAASEDGELSLASLLRATRARSALATRARRVA